MLLVAQHRQFVTSICSYGTKGENYFLNTYPQHHEPKLQLATCSQDPLRS